MSLNLNRSLIYTGGIGLFEAHVHAAIEVAAAKAAEITHDHLDEPGHGIHWPWLPHRSSAPGEYPARQYGPLQDSVGYEAKGLAQFVVGSIKNPPPESIILEFSPVFVGGRPWLSKSMEDPETHNQMNAAIAGEGMGM